MVACTEYMTKDFERMGRAVECLPTTAEDLLLEQLAEHGTISPRLDGRYSFTGSSQRAPFRALPDTALGAGP